MNISAFNALLDKSLQILAAVLNGVDNVALLDYPEYGNVGDSMIWLGQVALLRRLNKKIVYAGAQSNFEEREVGDLVAAGTALLINGGGNFGTQWPHHQHFRERIMTLFPDALIVQMPQSMCFENGVALQRSRRVIANCRNLHLLVRDYPSLAFAQANFATHIALCPDSAFFLSELPPQRADLDVVYLRRTDKEAETIDSEPPDSSATVAVTDWLQQSRAEQLFQKVLRALLRRRLLRNTQRVAIALHDALARLRVRRGIRLIARGRCVITDRLHAHVLSILLGRPHVLLDNSNGKVFAFHEAWTRDLGVGRRADSLREALQMAGTFNLMPLLAWQFFAESDLAAVALTGFA